jgi:hypothetical protein
MRQHLSLTSANLMLSYSTKIVSSEWRLHGTQFGDLAKSFTSLSLHSLPPLTSNQSRISLHLSTQPYPAVGQAPRRACLSLSRSPPVAVLASTRRSRAN